MKIVLLSISLLITLSCKSSQPEPKTVMVKQNSDTILILPIETRNIYIIPQLGKDIQDLISFHLIEKGFQVSFVNDLGLFKIKPESFDQKSPISSSNPISGEFRTISDNIQLMLSKSELRNYISSTNIRYLLQTSVSIYSSESIKDPSSSIIIFIKLFDTNGSVISMSTFTSNNLELSDIYKGTFIQKSVSSLVFDITNKLVR
ncbi:hypothetical protein [Leptospira meyeri]|uniref:hypothetical protein n=1 Tax=Leptospira meyeri TaxID=29508 RepID=UPI0002BFEDCA|nr:hypothetical protein [Leptospira meyeri]EMJ90323.1 putative lipoprotein [Leptospira meyeri serovar Semaranga str. Veldrot Semarang 173]